MINLRAANALRALWAGAALPLASSSLLGQAIYPASLCLRPAFGFAFMQLFERNKLPAELDPIFKRQTKLKGHLKSKATKVYSKKLNTNVRKQKQKLKNHKGLLKRIKIVPPLLFRSVPDGTDGSSSNHQAPAICTGINHRPI
jgi:hypothetical protein